MVFIRYFSYIITSIVMVICSHLTYNYLSNTFTTKRIRYLGQFQNEKYLEIINELKNHELSDNIEKHYSNNDIDQQIGVSDMSQTKKNDMQQSLLDLVKLSM